MGFPSQGSLSLYKVTRLRPGNVEPEGHDAKDGTPKASESLEAVGVGDEVRRYQMLQVPSVLGR